MSRLSDFGVGFAPAKVNLYLNVAHPRDDGYHPIESLFAFCALGDELRFDPGGALRLRVDGPFASQVPRDESNLVLCAADRLFEVLGRVPRGTFHLTKVLPVGSGLGGGSSDAASALRLMARALAIDEPTLLSVASGLGADIPACLGRRSCFAGGIGTRLVGFPSLPSASLLLATPSIALSTRSIYEAFDSLGEFSSLSGGAHFPYEGYRDFVEALKVRGNDLTRAACCVAPEVLTLLGTLKDLVSGVDRDHYVSMSGSGSTCFALLPDIATARGVLKRARLALPDHWFGVTAWL